MPSSSRILPADPKATYLAAKEEIDAAIARVLASGTYILGPEVAAFEDEFSRWLGAAGVVGVANGTDAIELALRACGVGAGDAVATVANTVTATVSAIVATGAEPVFVEIEPDTMLMSATALSACLRGPGAGRIKAVVPVHLYGQACDMPAILEVARRHGLKVVEDCAQAHGAKVAGRTAGTWGDLAAFSFYPTKNLGALGDAGAVAAGDPALLERVRTIRQYGWRTRYVSDEHGRNSRLDEIQAAILRVRLARLDAENAHRQALADHYLSALGSQASGKVASTRYQVTGNEQPVAPSPSPSDNPQVADNKYQVTSNKPPSALRPSLLPLRLPFTAPGRTHTWHQFVVRTARREALKAHLEKQGIICGILYPVPIHHQPAYARSISLPETDRACAEVLSLPLHAGMTAADVDQVLDSISRWSSRGHPQPA